MADKTEVTKYWFTCTKFTVRVDVNAKGMIVWTAPITRRFIGQPLANLEKWVGACTVLPLRDIPYNKEKI